MWQLDTDVVSGGRNRGRPQHRAAAQPIAGRTPNDVYQLVGLAITLKCGWLASPLNSKRIKRHVPARESAAGNNSGRIRISPSPGAWRRTGYSINVAKRAESASRSGAHFRVYLTDTAFKQIGPLIGNLYPANAVALYHASQGYEERGDGRARSQRSADPPQDGSGGTQRRPPPND